MKIWFLSFLSFLIPVSCERSGEFKTVALYSVAKGVIDVKKLDGIYLFGNKDTRDNLTGILHYKVRASLTSWGKYIEVEYPVSMEWYNKNDPKNVFKFEINKIHGIRQGQTQIEGEGTLVIIFGEKDYACIAWTPRRHLNGTDLDLLYKQYSEENEEGCENEK